MFTRHLLQKSLSSGVVRPIQRLDSGRLAIVHYELPYPHNETMPGLPVHQNSQLTL